MTDKKHGKEKKKKEKRGGVDHLTEKQIQRRGETLSRKTRTKHKELEGLYKTLLKEVPEIKEKFVEGGFAGPKPGSEKGVDHYISELTEMLPKEMLPPTEGTKNKISKRSISRIRQQGKQIEKSKEIKNKETVNLIRKTAESLRKKEEFKDLSNRKISKEIRDRLQEKGVNLSDETIRVYLGKRGDRILKKKAKSKKEKKQVTPSKKDMEEVKRNLKELKENGILDKTAYNKKNLSNLPGEEIRKLKKITNRALEQEEDKIQEIKETKRIYSKGEKRERRIELEKLGHSLSEVEQVLPRCSNKEKKELMEKARKNPSKSLFDIKKEL